MSWWEPGGLRLTVRAPDGQELRSQEWLTLSEKFRLFVWNRLLPTRIRLRWIESGRDCWWVCASDIRLFGRCAHGRRERECGA